MILGKLWGLPPALDMEREKRVHEAMIRIVEEGLAESAHDLSDGGLAVALAECSFGAAGIGAVLNLDSDLRPEFLCYGEAPSRILISTANPARVAAIARQSGVEALEVGVTTAHGIEIRQRSVTLGSWEIAAVRSVYEGGLKTHVG